MLGFKEVQELGKRIVRYREMRLMKDKLGISESLQEVVVKKTEYHSDLSLDEAKSLETTNWLLRNGKYTVVVMGRRFWCDTNPIVHVEKKEEKPPETHTVPDTTIHQPAKKRGRPAKRNR